MDPRRRDGRYGYCRPCKAAYMKDRRAVRPDEARRHNAVHNLRKVGATPQLLEALLVFQGGRCAICWTDEPTGNHGRMVIDHDHATMVVRGLLCGHCNMGLGAFRDDPARLAAAAEYLAACAAT